MLPQETTLDFDLHKEPSFSLGIEEEYLLVNPATGALILEAPPTMLADCEAQLEGQVTTELFQSQIEVGTRVCKTLQAAREELAHLRRTVSSVARQYDLAIIAASTHPHATWGEQKHTRKAHYETLAKDMQVVARRMLISGMHVHAGVEDDDLRIDLMNQTKYILPHLLALSTSSPFWEGRDTGLRSYRIAVWNELPRTGLPEHYESYAEFRRHYEILAEAGVIKQATAGGKIWWDIWPSFRFPTLEMRVSDICTRLEDGISIAALYRCWLRMLWRLRQKNQRWRTYKNLLIDENRWRAQRYGFLSEKEKERLTPEERVQKERETGLIDFGRGRVVPYGQLLEELLGYIHEDAEHFGCVDEVNHARTILERGTSAHWQVAAYHEARAAGADEREAIKAVVDMLIRETTHGL